MGRGFRPVIYFYYNDFLSGCKGKGMLLPVFLKEEKECLQGKQVQICKIWDNLHLAMPGNILYNLAKRRGEFSRPILQNCAASLRKERQQEVIEYDETET